MSESTVPYSSRTRPQVIGLSSQEKKSGRAPQEGRPLTEEIEALSMSTSYPTKWAVVNPRVVYDDADEVEYDDVWFCDHPDRQHRMRDPFRSEIIDAEAMGIDVYKVHITLVTDDHYHVVYMTREDVV